LVKSHRPDSEDAIVAHDGGIFLLPRELAVYVFDHRTGRHQAHTFKGALGQEEEDEAPSCGNLPFARRSIPKI
jgi:hypothetical protein